MATLLLDTSVIIDAINNKKDRRQFLRELIVQGNTLACCPINVTEVYAGVRPAEELNTRAFLESLKYYPITWPAARMAGELKRDFAKRGATLSVTDTLIAAVAIEYKLALITDNTRDFPMKDLQMYPLPER
jgi:predicted nucleic acid-binding protein